MNSTANIPLCVDLDGTLIKTDLLWESCLLYLKQNPLHVFNLIIWLFKGKANLKHQLAARVQIYFESLPYDSEIMTYLKEQKGLGRKILLVTGSHQKIVKPIFDHTKLFDEFLATHESLNLSGHQKAKKLTEIYGNQGFDYIGNESADIPVWRAANMSLVMAPGALLKLKLKLQKIKFTTIGSRKSTILAVFKALRIHQWSKNIIIFIPILAAHKLFETQVIQQSVLAFVSFCMFASSGYILNDILDIEADRNHSKKKSRPFASGALSIPIGFILLLTLFAAGFLIAQATTKPFVLVVLGYFVLTCSYSIYLKSQPIVDVIVLAGLYTIRIFAGHEATAIKYSHWLLSFSFFFFLCLALVKRYSELFELNKKNVNNDKVSGRDYVVSDLNTVLGLGVSTGTISVLIIFLYLTSPDVYILYKAPQFLWLVIPVLTYWISRLWLLAGRGEVNQDPVIFALKDRASYIVFAIVFIVLFLST